MRSDSTWRQTTLIIGALALSQPAVADPPVPGVGVSGRAGAGVYADGMSTTVISPRARASGTLPAQIRLEAHWTADVVTSASVDVVTAATSKMSELRNEAGLSLRREDLLPDLDVQLGYAYSTERDADSHMVRLALQQELFCETVELGLRGGTSINRVGVVGQAPGDWHDLSIHDLDVMLGLVLDPATLLELEASAYLAFGYQANPYRLVPIQRGPDLRGASWMPEIVPDRRLRFAASARLQRTLGARWTAIAEYRAYADDWGLVAHMESLELAVALVPDELTLRLRERGTTSGRARFYRARYEDPTTYRTRDRRLGPSQSIAGGLALEWEFGTTEPWPFTEANTSVMFAADALAWHFPDFYGRALTYAYSTSLERLGWVGGIVAQLELVSEW